MTQRVITLHLDPETIAAYAGSLPIDPAEAPHLLSQVIADNLARDGMSDLILTLRLFPQPLLAAFGEFTSAQEARLNKQVHSILAACRHLLYVSYAQAEADSHLLAEHLQARWGQDAVARFRYTAIPRGGLIVLGMLAYQLGLGRDRLEAPDLDETLVVVDDCAISGFRLGEFLARTAQEKVIFALLYAHPDLCWEIERQEPRVLACLSGRDLHDHASVQLGENYPGWLARARERMGSGRYWIGIPEQVCFPWNEPDRLVWDDEVQRNVRGWRLLPPELCLKNHLPQTVKPLVVQIQLPGKGPLRPTDTVIYARVADQVVLGNIRTGAAFGLAGTGADMWLAIVEYGSLEAVVHRLLSVYAVDESDLRQDVQRFTSDLIQRGLLEDEAGGIG